MIYLEDKKYTHVALLDGEEPILEGVGKLKTFCEKLISYKKMTKDEDTTVTCPKCLAIMAKAENG